MVKYLTLLICSKLNLKENRTSIENFTQFKDKKTGYKIFCLKIIFLSGLYEKFHIKFAVHNVFEVLVSTRVVQCSFQWFILFKSSVNYVVSTKKWSYKSIQDVPAYDIFNSLTEFFLCKWDFLWINWLWIIIMLQVPQKTNFNIIVRLIKEKIPVKNAGQTFWLAIT